MMRHILIACIALTPGPLVAQSQTATCTTSIEGETQTIAYDPNDPALADNTSLRERARARLGLGGDACAGYVILRQLTPELSDAERGPFCAVYDAENQTYAGFAAGARDAWGTCVEEVGICDRVAASRDAAMAVAGLGEGDAADEAAPERSRLQALRERATGATILSGPAGAVSGAMSNIGAAAVAAATAPAAIAAAAVTVVAVGGAVYACSGPADGAPADSAPAESGPADDSSADGTSAEGGAQ